MALFPGKISSDTLRSPVPITPRSAPCFTGVDCITIRYRTNGDLVRNLIPDNLSMEKEPIVTMMISDYGMSPLVSYHELIHYVEVTYNGKKYDYAVLLVLDNEDGAYGGREIWGYPKVLGEFDFDLGKVDKSGFIRARCSRPANTPIVEFLFKPISLLQNREVPRPSNTGLNLRLIPSPVPGAKPSVRQFVELDFRLLEGEIWEGVGSLNFPSKSEFDLLHKSPVVEYLSAHFFHNCSAALDPPINIFDF